MAAEKMSAFTTGDYDPTTDVLVAIRSGNLNRNLTMPAPARQASTKTNSTNVLSPITDLTVNVVAGKYVGELVLFARNSTAAEGIQITFDGGNATLTNFIAGFSATPPGSGLVLGTVTTADPATPLTVTTATTVTAVYRIPFSFVCSVAGTLIPQIAENSAHTSGTVTAGAGGILLIDRSLN